MAGKKGNLHQEAVQKGRSTKYNNYVTVMPDTDPPKVQAASPAFNKERRSRIGHGMTPFLDSILDFLFLL